MILLCVAAPLIVPMGCTTVSSNLLYLRANMLFIIRAQEAVLTRKVGSGAQ